MKKILFLAALALSTASAWAQKVTGTDDSVITEGWYQIQVGSGNAQDHATYKDYYLAGYPRTVSGNNWGVGLTQDGTDANTYVYITGSHNAFHMQFRKGGSGNFAEYYTNFNCLNNGTTGNLSFIPSADGEEWKIWGNNVQRWMGWNLGGPAVGSTSGNNDANNNCYFTFTKVESLPQATLPEVGKKYHIAFRLSDGSKKYVKGTGFVADAASADILLAGESGDATYPLTFMTSEGNYLTSHGVQSTATKNEKVIFKTGRLNDGTYTYVTCPTAVRAANAYLTAKQRWVNTSEGNMIIKEATLAYDGSTAPYMNGTYTSALIFEEVTEDFMEVTYTIVHNGQTLGTKTINEVVGGTPSITFPSYVEATDLPTTVENDAYTVNTTYNSTMPFATEKPYYLQFIVSGSGTFWWYNNDAAKELKNNGPESGNEAKAQWIIGGDWLNGFTFQSRYDNMYLTSPAKTSTNVQAQLTADATELSRYELLHKTGDYTGFYFKVMGGTACLAHTSATNLNLSMWNDANYRGNIVTFVAVPESFDVAVSSAGYATLYYSEALTIPSGVKAYTIKVEDNWAKATEVTGTIPSKTGVIIEAEAGTHTFPTTLSEAFAGDNDLQGTLVEKTAPENCFTLAVKDGEVGFYKYTGEKVAAYKAYYVAPAGASNLRISFDELTSIISAAQQNGGQAIFDLQGRRVVNAQNGLYIVNGKKVIR